MKKQFFKLVSVVIVLLCASISMSAAVDWSNYAFIGDGTGSGKYANKYKVETVEGLNVVNIQKPGFANEDGIYVTVPAGISECSVASAISGAGVVIYLSGLTAQENEVTIKYDTPSKEITFHIYYADGSSGTKQASDLTLTAPATTKLDLHIGDDFTIQYTTSSKGAVAFSSSNTDVATVSADGVITALAAGTTTITVSQAEDETYNAGSKSFTLSVIEVYGGQCTFSGKAGDGQSHDKGTSLFTKGYNISLYLNSRKDTIFVKAAFLDDETATSALFQNYPQRDEKVEVKEWRFNREGETQVFSGKVPVSELSNKADGIIRFGIKFEFDGGLRVTTPEFYYLDGLGCAERDFVIYHHHQKPADDKSGAVESFAGGRILQPIQYKRKLRPDVWETLSIPFEVDSVTVTDEDGVYKIYPQYDNNGTVEGEFWLREFREKEVSAEKFQANWHDIQATTAKDALPKKNVPYIIRVPDDVNHYWADKYIVFHGASYQTIDDVYFTDVQTPRATEMFAYSGNNTMKQWQLRSAYVLDNEGIYFESGEKVILYPFECAVNANIETTRAMPRLALNRKPGVPTGNLPPTTAVEPGNVWSVTGWYVGSFCDSNQYDRLMQRLPAGMYVVRQAETTYKVYIAK